MIWSTVVFDAGTTLQAVIGALRALPDPLRTTRHSDGEDAVRRPIEDVSAPLGSILWAEQASYHAWAPTGQVECRCEFKTRAAPLVGDFMERMAALKPVFGFASAWDEYRHRNQLDVRLRIVRIQAFVGKDLTKYIPGVYWFTLLPDALTERHGVPLAKLEAAALEHVALGGGQRLFRFHDHPGAWRGRADELDGLCAALPGIFNIADVRARLVGVTEEKEFDAIVDPWR